MTLSFASENCDWGPASKNCVLGLASENSVLGPASDNFMFLRTKLRLVNAWFYAPETSCDGLRSLLE